MITLFLLSILPFVPLDFQENPSPVRPFGVDDLKRIEKVELAISNVSSKFMTLSERVNKTTISALANRMAQLNTSFLNSIALNVPLESDEYQQQITFDLILSTITAELNNNIDSLVNPSVRTPPQIKRTFGAFSTRLATLIKVYPFFQYPSDYEEQTYAVILSKYANYAPKTVNTLLNQQLKTIPEIRQLPFKYGISYIACESSPTAKKIIEHYESNFGKADARTKALLEQWFFLSQRLITTEEKYQIRQFSNTLSNNQLLQ